MPAPSQEAPCTWSLLLAGQPLARSGKGLEHALAPRDAALLAWLALEGPTQRQRLAELLWPESTADAARNVLRQRVFQLKKQFGDGLLVVGRNTLALHPGVEHDLEASDDVLSPLSAEFSGELSLWLEKQRLQRLQRRSDALAAAADQAEAAADWASALQCARQLLTLNPLSEAAHRRVMHLHYLAGDRAAALLAFDACEKHLKDEIGTRPSSETLLLLETIERSHPGVAGERIPGGRVPASVLRPPQLVGRQHHWELLRQSWSDCGLVALSGEPGSGKSRLLAELATTLGDTVLFIQARPGDDAVPYAMVARLARPLLARVGRVLAAQHLRELARVLPELGTPPSASSRSALALHEALAALLELAQSRGLAGLMLDDLQFADAASLDTLRPVLASTPTLAWLVAFRPNQLSDAGRDLLHALLQNNRARSVQLEPLDGGAVRELIGSLGLGPAADDPLAKALMRRTGGNPMYVLETLKCALQRGLPLTGPLPVAHSVTQLIAQRLGGLSAVAMKIARCAGVAGQDFSPDLATDVLGAGPLDLADGWAELESAQLLRDNNFAHDLIQEAALSTVPPSLARRLHTLVARHLVSRSGGVHRIAYHWESSETPLEAVPYLLESGKQAALALRITEARLSYGKAARLLNENGREHEAFSALMALLDQLYNPADAVVEDALQQLEQLARTPEQLARIAERRADVVARQGDFESSGRIATQALNTLDTGQFPALAAQLLCKAAAADLVRGQHDAAIERMHRAIELATRSSDDEAIGTTASYFGSVLDHSHRYAEAYLAHRRALELARRRQSPIEVISVAANIAGNRTQLGMFEAALEMIDLAYRTAGENTIDLDSQWPSLLAHHGLALRGTGQYRRAIRALEDALTTIGRYMPGWLPGVYNMQAVLWLELGQVARAMQAAQAALQVAAPGLSRYRTRALLLIAEINALGTQQTCGALQAEIEVAMGDASPLSSHQTGLSRVPLLEPDEGYALALRLRAEALAHQMPNQVLEAEVRCAGAALHLGKSELAASHARAALSRLRETSPTTMYRGEVWLVTAQALAPLAPGESRQVLQDAEHWIRQTSKHCVPDEFQESFLHRNPANRTLLGMAARTLDRTPGTYKQVS